MFTVTNSDTNSLYAKILTRSEEYDDKFVFAVTSTGVYCRPSCPARRPLLKNCRFFDTPKQAEENGFRECKRCRPNHPKNESVIRLLRQLEGSGHLSTDDIRHLSAQLTMSERHLRRRIKNSIGETPLQISRKKQLEYAYYLLQHTMLPVTDIAFSSDFTSIRQFNEAFKQKYGKSPRQVRQQEETT